MAEVKSKCPLTMKDSHAHHDAQVCRWDPDHQCATCGGHGHQWNPAFSGLSKCSDNGFGCGEWLCFACTQTRQRDAKYGAAGVSICDKCVAAWAIRRDLAALKL